MWSIWFPWETNLAHKRWLSPTDGESDFLPMQVFFFRVWHNAGFCDKSIVFLLLAQNLGDASQACYQSTLISRMSFFIQWYFPLSGRSTNENLWDIVASSLFLGPSWLRRSLVPSCTARFARPDRRACLQAICINGSDKFETGQNKGLFSDNKDNQLLTYWYEPQLASLWPTAIWFQHFVRHFKSIGLKNRGKIRPQGHYNLVNLVPC